MQSTIVTLKYPFDIANIVPKQIHLSETFTSGVQEVLNVECFGSVKYEAQILLRRLTAENPNYTHKVYAWRSKRCLPAGSTTVHRLRWVTKVNKLKAESHTTLELLGGIWPKACVATEDTPIPTLSEDTPSLSYPLTEDEEVIIPIRTRRGQ